MPTVDKFPVVVPKQPSIPLNFPYETNPNKLFNSLPNWLKMFICYVNLEAKLKSKSEKVQ